MSKNIIIQQGGVGKQFTATKLETALVGGGSCLWVPEDETRLGTKHISANGTYLASEDGYYGFSQVTVNVPGGSGGPPGGHGSSIHGLDPDGDDALITVDDQGNLDMKKIPSTIVITTLPPRLEYNDGDLIDPHGIVVKAYLKTGELFTDETYPDGIIPYNELQFPEKVAHFDMVGPDYDPNVSAAGAYLATVNDRRFTKYNNEPAECVYVDRKSWYGPFLISTTYDGATYYSNEVKLYPHESVSINDVQYFINSEYHYPMAAINTPFPVYEDKTTDNPILITRRILNAGAGDDQMDVPVVWLNPYTQLPMETFYTITAAQPQSGT